MPTTTLNPSTTWVASGPVFTFTPAYSGTLSRLAVLNGVIYVLETTGLIGRVVGGVLTQHWGGVNAGSNGGMGLWTTGTTLYLATWVLSGTHVQPSVWTINLTTGAATLLNSQLSSVTAGALTVAASGATDADLAIIGASIGIASQQYSVGPIEGPWAATTGKWQQRPFGKPFARRLDNGEAIIDAGGAGNVGVVPALLDATGTFVNPYSALAPGTTVAAGSNGVNVASFTGAGVLHVASIAGYPPTTYPATSGGLVISIAGSPIISYSGISGGAFTGCKLLSGSGTLATGNSVAGLLFRTGASQIGAAATVVGNQILSLFPGNFGLWMLPLTAFTMASYVQFNTGGVAVPWDAYNGFSPTGTAAQDICWDPVSQTLYLLIYNQPFGEFQVWSMKAQAGWTVGRIKWGSGSGGFGVGSHP